MSQKREVVEGAVYVPRGASRRKFRRVIAIIDATVFYSSGGNRNFMCSLRAFKRATKGEPMDAAALHKNCAEDLFSLP